MKEGISFPKAILMGTKVQLRGEAFKDITVREWQFSGVDKGKLVLSLPEGLIQKVKLEDMDWKNHNQPKIEDGILNIKACLSESGLGWRL